NFARAAFEFVESLRPVPSEEARHRAVGEEPAAGLAARAVIRLILGVDDPLNRGAARGARLTIAAVHGHLGAEGRDLLGEARPGLRREAVPPRDERRPDRLAAALDLSLVQSATDT